MSQQDVLARILHTGVVPVVRAQSGEAIVELAEALAAGGVDIIEITLTVPGAPRVIEEVSQKLGDRVLVGAGTVLDAETARVAILSGARFIVSPTVNHDVIRLSHRYGAVVMPGAMTPTEILGAWEAGADLVKVFPTEVLGPAYFKAIRGPLPQVRLLPSGGVNLETAGEFLRAGAAALAVGGALIEQKALAARDFKRIENLARQFVGIVREHRSAD